MKYYRIMSLAIGVFFLTAAVMISPAEAKTKKYMPKKFAELFSGQDSMRLPAVVGASASNPTGVIFTAPVRLPAGTEVTGLDMWCSLAPGGEASVKLIYLDPSVLPVIPRAMYSAETTAPTADTFTPRKVDGVPLVSPADRVIRKGNFYYLQAELATEGFLWRADLSYQP